MNTTERARDLLGSWQRSHDDQRGISVEDIINERIEMHEQQLRHYPNSYVWRDGLRLLKAMKRELEAGA